MSNLEEQMRQAAIELEKMMGVASNEYLAAGLKAYLEELEQAKISLSRDLDAHTKQVQRIVANFQKKE